MRHSTTTVGKQLWISPRLGLGRDAENELGVFDPCMFCCYCPSTTGSDWLARCMHVVEGCCWLVVLAVQSGGAAWAGWPRVPAWGDVYQLWQGSPIQVAIWVQRRTWHVWTVPPCIVWGQGSSGEVQSLRAGSRHRARIPPARAASLAVRAALAYMPAPTHLRPVHLACCRDQSPQRRDGTDPTVDRLPSACKQGSQRGSGQAPPGQSRAAPADLLSPACPFIACMPLSSQGRPLLFPPALTTSHQPPGTPPTTHLGEFSAALPPPLLLLLGPGGARWHTLMHIEVMQKPWRPRVLGTCTRTARDGKHAHEFGNQSCPPFVITGALRCTSVAAGPSSAVRLASWLPLCPLRRPSRPHVHAPVRRPLHFCAPPLPPACLPRMLLLHRSGTSDCTHARAAPWQPERAPPPHPRQ